MRLISYLENKDDIGKFSQADVSELILSSNCLSRMGRLETCELESLAKLCRKADIRPVLDWDSLMTEEVFAETLSVINSLDLSLFAAIRLQDPGAVQYILSHHPQMPIQLILESGNHNLPGILSWVEILGEQLDRLVLSIQLTGDKLREYVGKVKAPIEILGLGRILLFHSPRKLLSYQAAIHELDIQTEFKSALASSEEGRHKGFRVVENSQGTLLFHPKNYCLLDKFSELADMGIDALRLDLRFDGDLSLLEPIADLTHNPGGSQFKIFKDKYPVPVTRSFYRSNKTDAIFPKLKNTGHSRLDDRYLGEVIEAKRDSATIIMIKHPERTLEQGQSIEIVNSLGKSTTIRVHGMRNAMLESIHSASQDQIVILPYIKSAPARSRIYL